jgi:hypothetical protein
MQEKLDIDPLLAWCEQEVVLLRKQIDRLQSGQMAVQQMDDTGRIVETTTQTISQLEAKLSTLEDLVASRQKKIAEN